MSQAKPKTTEGEKPALPVRKQAVVVIHGMGEPVPMDTMRSFVDAVWEKDAAFVPSAPQNSRAGEDNEYWLVPDQRTGSLELFRITTPPFKKKGDDNPTSVARTDFYEFYWSDIMVGTTFEHVRAWMSGLLFRWPHQVPRRMLWAWILLWVAVILAAASAVAGMAQFAPGLQIAWFDAWIQDWGEAIGLTVTVLATVIAALRLVSQRYRARIPPNQKWRPIASWILAVAFPAALLIAGLCLVNWSKVLSATSILLLISALLAFIIQRFLVPYFGDVARYVRAAPETVAKRAEVRERGLQLLRELHRTSSSHDSADKDDGYQRIVIVAHSLGSIIAYDILSHFWAEAGPTGPHNPPKGPVVTALRNMDSYLKKNVKMVHAAVPGARAGTTAMAPSSVFQDSFDPTHFRDLQRNLSRALVRQGGSKAWRITDFVTLGSPLSHAEFLMARDILDLRQKMSERQIATCPPYPDPATGSIRFPRPGEGKEEYRYAHHASVFAATRWTNIYDPHSAIFFGDLISGPVSCRTDSVSSVADDLFGRGVHDIGVRMRRRWFAFSRLFTHTRYWSLDVTGKRVNGNDKRPKPKGSDHDKDIGHVIELRKAVNLAEIFD